MRGLYVARESVIRDEGSGLVGHAYDAGQGESQIPNPTLPRRGGWRGAFHVRERKSPLVGELGDPLVGRTIPVRALRFDADEDRAIASLTGLQRRRELERMARHDAVIVVGR